MKHLLKNLAWLVLSLTLPLATAVAQVEVGDNVKLNLSGEVSTGYSANSGDGQQSSHAFDFGGAGDLHGYYYNPQFLSFDVQPFYNRSQANSAFQSITNSSGFTATTNIFGGSRFPGSISFSRTSDSTGQFSIPGATGLTTDGSGQTFVINWAALLPGLPTLNASYVMTGNDSSLLGTDARSSANGRTLNLRSDYTLDGFQLNGYMVRQTNSQSLPSFLVDGLTQNASDGDSKSLTFGALVNHRIPLDGYWSARASRSTFSNDTQANGVQGTGDGSSDSLSTTVSVTPLRRLGMSFGVIYQDNVFGALQQQIAQLGAVTPLRTSDLSSSALTFRGNADYQVFRFLRVNAQVNHTNEYLEGRTIGVTQYGAGVSTSFTRRLLGTITLAVGALDTATQEGNSGASMYGSVGFSRRFGNWETGADANYAQQVQTLGNVYVTSMYGYGGSVKRKISDHFYWMNTARQTRSGLAQQAGTSSHSESFLTTVIYRRYSVNAVYSQSGGAAILTSQGLVPVPGGIPSPIITSPVLYGASSYGGGITAQISRFTLTGSYSKALSQTQALSASNNSTTMWNALLRCRMRKLYLNAGFTRFQQSVTAIGTQPTMLNSYFFGVSRWFNIF